MADIEEKPITELKSKEDGEMNEQGDADAQKDADEILESENHEKEMIIFNRILMGAFDDSIPEPKRKLVRIFTSSTFTDTLVERNYLMENIYPRLKVYCREYHNLIFQVVDMRWGVRDESTDEHKTAELCMAEIDACQRLSLGPNFVKYGYRPLQKFILDTEFEMLCEVSAKEDADLLRKWYWLDKNMLPAKYVLLKISTYYKHFCNKAEKALMQQDQGLWWANMAKMNTIIRKASLKLMKQNRFSRDDNHRYNNAVTEQEVIRGICEVENNTDYTFAFIRIINNINIPLFAHSCKYIDINFAERKLDQEAVDMMADMRDRVLPSTLDAGSIVHYNIEWSDEGGMNATDHADYLVKFGEEFYIRIVQLIERAINKLMKISANKLYTEVLQHCFFCKNFSKQFLGRDELVSKANDYLYDLKRVQPLVMYGPSGSGKSSVIAKLASMIKERTVNNTPVVVIRFIGTTPSSSSISPLLTSLCEQISHNYDKPLDIIPTELSNLTNFFKKLLESATPEKPLYIFLDSLDQLSPANSAHTLTWIPVFLPENCKFVVTSLEGYFNIIETLMIMIEDKQQFIMVESLGEKLGLTMIQERLAGVNRTISDIQMNVVKECLNTCNTALYCKLVFDQVRLWKSYTEDILINKTITDCIGDCFGRVENAHGKVLVATAMAYVTASKNGLGESEVEDLISIDETVLNDIYQYHLPPIRRIPPLLWTRIRSEIPEYLSEREADGITVVSWYHRPFIHVAIQRYLYDPKFTMYIHSQIADFFIGTWAKIAKPFQYTADQMRMFKLRSPHGEAERNVPEQPEIYYSTVDNSEKYNGRKLSELPFHLIRSKRVDELFKLVLFHYKFLYAKLCCNPLNNLIADFEDYLDNFGYQKEVVLIADALRLSSSILSVSPTNLVPQLVGRLLPYYFKNSKKFENVKRLIEECETDGLYNSALIPAFNCFMVPGGPLKFSLEGHPFAIYGMHLMAGGTQLFSVSNRFMVFDLSSGDLMRVINPGVEGIMQSLSVSPDGKFSVSYSNTDSIVLCNIISGETQIFKRYTTPMPANYGITQPILSKKKGKKNLKAPPLKPLSKAEAAKAAAELEAARIAYTDYNDTFIGNHSSNEHFVMYSKFFVYVYDKKARLIKATKFELPIIQVELVENESIRDYGVELEIMTRDRDIKEDEDVSREYYFIYYMPVLDQICLKPNVKIENNLQPLAVVELSNIKVITEENFENTVDEDQQEKTIQLDNRLTEEEVMKMYIPTGNRIECHSCARMTKDKKKLFTCTELADNVIECFRNRTVKVGEKKKNLWKYHGSMDDNKEAISQIILSEDEKYMLAVQNLGFKVYYIVTGTSKPLKLPSGVKNVAIGYKKFTFPAVFSKDNRYVVAGVRDNIYIWETSYGLFIKTLDAHYGRINIMLSSSTGQKNLVLSGSMDKTIKIWNIQNILEEDFPLDHLDKPVEMLHVSIQAEIALAQSRNQLVIISLRDGRIKNSLCNSPHGAIFSCSALTNSGLLAASSESNRLVVWNVETKTTIFVSSMQSKTVSIMQLQFHQKDACLLCAYLDTTKKMVSLTNYSLSIGEKEANIVYTEEFAIKTANDYKNFILTTDDMYLVFYRDDKKCDMLAVHLALEGTLCHNIKLTYVGWLPKFSYLTSMRANPHLVALIDAEKGNLINIKEKKYVRSIKNWNGKFTSDDKYGLYAPTRGGLELLELKNGTRVKVFIPKVAEGVFEVDTLITGDDKHILYYHTGKRTIRIYRISDSKKIADYKSTAKIRTIICAQDNYSIVFGCEDGTVNMLLIADSEDQAAITNIRAWRKDQLKLFLINANESPSDETEDNGLLKQQLTIQEDADTLESKSIKDELNQEENQENRKDEAKDQVKEDAIEGSNDEVNKEVFQDINDDTNAEYKKEVKEQTIELTNSNFSEEKTDSQAEQESIETILNEHNDNDDIIIPEGV